MKDSHDLTLLLHSQIPIIFLETKEEHLAIDLLKKVSTNLFIPLYHWSITEGLLRLEDGFSPQRHNTQPQDVLGHIKSSLHPGVFILSDFHPYLNDPLLIRLLKDIAISYADSPRTIVFVSHEISKPEELANFSAGFKLSLPSKEQIKKTIKQIANDWSASQNGLKVEADKKAYAMLLENLKGLTLSEVKRVARAAIYDDGAITESDVPGVIKAKYELLDLDSVLQFEYNTEKFSAVAGFTAVKQWLEHRKQSFLEEVAGLKPPKGMLLLGVQGCGKSLVAKSVAGIWGVPLLHLDFGALFNKYHGETEKNLRKSLETAEIMAPCVLWVDEIEKGLSVSNNDGGTSQRVLGTLLTWLAEKTSSVFMVATANNIEALPPELIRKGRFDEIFFVDLPKQKVRMKIFSIHLKRRKLNAENFDLELLAKATEGYSGAEIEQAIVAALYSSHAEGQQVNNDMIMKSIKQTKPLSVVMSEPIERLRLWAKDRTVSAD